MATELGPGDGRRTAAAGDGGVDPGAVLAAGGADSRSQRIRWSAAAVGVLAAVVAAWGSWIPSLWGDEAATVLSAKRTLPSLWAMAQHVDAMHAGYYFLMHFWIVAFGASAFSVRLPSALAVGAGAAGLFVLMRILGRNPWAAVLTAAVFVVLPRIQYAGQEARSFAWDAALVTWTLVAVVLIAEGRLPRRLGWVLYGAGVAVSTALFPYDGSVVAIAGVVLVPVRNRRLRLPWAVSSGVALVVASPVLWLSFMERGQVAYLASTPLTPSRVLVSTWFGHPVFAGVAWALVVLGLLAGVRRYGASRPSPSSSGDSAPGLLGLVLLAAWAFVPGVALLVTQPLIHNYAERYLTFCAPAVAGLVAEGVAELWVWRHTGAVVAIAAVAAVSIPAGFHQRTPFSENESDWAQLASYIHDRAQPGQDIVFAQTVSPSKRARNSLRLYPQEFRGLRDVALTKPWYESATSWHDAALTIGQAAESGRIVSSRAWVVESRGSGSEGWPELRALGYKVIAHRHFDLDTVYELSR